MILTRSMMLAAALGTLSLAACTSTVAPGAEEPAHGASTELAASPSQHGRGFGAAQLFQQADKNADGRLTADEWNASAGERFAAADANKDGQLDATELAALAPNGGGRRGGPPMQMLDSDGDGKVSLQEFTSHVAQRFQRADADNDGVVTQQEWSSRAPGMGGHGPGMGGRGPGMRGPGAGMGMHGGPNVEQMFAKADADHDGKVTRAEADALRARLFAEADSNHDGKLDQAEIEAMRAQHRGQRGGDRFAQLDRDGDGKISKQEAPPRLAARFDELDSNHDGQLSADEWSTAHAGMKMPGQGHGRGGPMMMDTNGDNEISAEEFGAMPARWFDLADANKDGAVTLDELRAARPGPMDR